MLLKLFKPTERDSELGHHIANSSRTTCLSLRRREALASRQFFSPLGSEMVILTWVK